MREKLEERKKKLTEEFDALTNAENDFVEQRKQIDKKLSEIRVRKIQLQGSYAEVEELLKPPPPPVEEEKKPNLKAVKK